MEEKTNRIQRLKIKKKKRVKKMKRAIYFFIPPVKKFINPFKVYRLFGDLILQEEFQYLSPKSSLYNKFKIITTVEKDCVRNLITVKLEDNKSTFSCAWQYLVSRMKSFGDTNAKAWAEAIESYCLGYLDLMEESKNQKTRIDKVTKLNGNIDLDSTFRLKESLIEKNALIILKFGQSENRMYLTHISFNETLLELLGYECNLMTTFLIKRGIPEFFPKNECTFVDYIKLLFKHFFNKSTLNSIGEQEAFLLTKLNYVKPMLVSPYIFYNVNEQGDVEYEVYLSFRVHPEKKMILSTIDDAYPGLDETIKSTEKEADDFFIRFYNQHYVGAFSNLDRICKVKQVQSYSAPLDGLL